MALNINPQAAWQALWGQKPQQQPQGPQTGAQIWSPQGAGNLPQAPIGLNPAQPEQPKQNQNPPMQGQNPTPQMPQFDIGAALQNQTQTQQAENAGRLGIQQQILGPQHLGMDGRPMSAAPQVDPSQLIQQGWGWDKPQAPGPFSWQAGAPRAQPTMNGQPVRPSMP